MNFTNSFSGIHVYDFFCKIFEQQSTLVHNIMGTNKYIKKHIDDVDFANNVARVDSKVIYQMKNKFYLFICCSKMKQSKSVFKFLLLAILLSLVYFKFHSKPCDSYAVDNYNVGVEMSLNGNKTVPITIG